MLRQGVIPPFIHGILGYAVGAFLILAPFVFDFAAGAAVAVSIVAGVVVVLLEASSDLPTALARVFPVGAHFVVELVVGAVLIAVPFVFGFSDETAPTATCIAVGVGVLLLTIGTKFVSAEPRT